MNAPVPIATIDRVAALETRVASLEAQVAELMELKTANPRRVFMTDVVKWRLPGALPDLQRRHRGVVTAKEVAAHFGYPLDSTRIGIRKAVDAGRVKWVRLPRRNKYVLLLPDQDPPRDLPLAESHLNILDSLKRLAVNGGLTMSNNQIALRMGHSPNTVNYAINRLVLAGRVRVIKRGEAGKPSTYFIPSALP